MKLAKMRIEGYAYLNDVIIVPCQDDITIILQLNEENNSHEMIRLKCLVPQDFKKYVISVLLAEYLKSQSILVKFEASYENFAEVFYTQNDQLDRIVLFDAKLEAIKAAYVNGALKSGDMRQKSTA